MAFRKTSYAKVFIDDELPSFLVPPESHEAPQPAPARAMNVSPALMQRPQAAVLPTAAPVDEAPQENTHHDRRNRALQLRPVFMLRVVLVALLLNAALYVVFNHLPLWVQSVKAGL